jgi:hypothetical protein
MAEFLPKGAGFVIADDSAQESRPVETRGDIRIKTDGSATVKTSRRKNSERATVGRKDNFDLRCRK